MRKLTRQKRRQYEAKRRERRQAEKVRMQVNEAAYKAKEAGRLEGIAQGSKSTKESVLNHAGQLYKEGKDADASAVREVHRKLA